MDDFTLQIGKQEFTFRLSAQDVTKHFNAVTPNSKVAASNNLLTNTIRPEHKDALRGNPVMVLQLAVAPG